MMLQTVVKSMISDVPIVVTQLYSSKSTWRNYGLIAGDFQNQG